MKFDVYEIDFNKIEGVDFDWMMPKIPTSQELIEKFTFLESVEANDIDGAGIIATDKYQVDHNGSPIDKVLIIHGNNQCQITFGYLHYAA